MPPLSVSLPAIVRSVTPKNTVLMLFSIYITSTTFSVSGRSYYFHVRCSVS